MATKLLEAQAAGQVQFQSLTNCENCTKFRYNGIQEKMGLSYGFLLQFLLAGRIGFYNGPDWARGPPIKNPWPRRSHFANKTTTVENYITLSTLINSLSLREWERDEIISWLYGCPPSDDKIENRLPTQTLDLLGKDRTPKKKNGKEKNWKWN